MAWRDLVACARANTKFLVEVATGLHVTSLADIGGLVWIGMPQIWLAALVWK